MQVGLRCEDPPDDARGFFVGNVQRQTERELTRREAKAVLPGFGLQCDFNHRNTVGPGPFKLFGCGLVLLALKDDILGLGVQLGLLDALAEPRFPGEDVESRHALAVFQDIDDELDALVVAFAVTPLEFLDPPVQASTDFDDADDQRLGFGAERFQRPDDLAGDLLAGVVELVTELA